MGCPWGEIGPLAVDSVARTTAPLAVARPGREAGAASVRFAPFASGYWASARSARPWRGWRRIAPPSRTRASGFGSNRRWSATWTRLRRCPKPARLTSNPSAFLRGNYDVVVEALDAVEPARTLVARLLGTRHARWSPPTRRWSPSTARDLAGDRRRARRRVPIRSHRVVGGAVSRHAGRSSVRVVGRSRARDRQRHLELPADVARRAGRVVRRRRSPRAQELGYRGTRSVARSRRPRCRRQAAAADVVVRVGPIVARGPRRPRHSRRHRRRSRGGAIGRAAPSRPWCRPSAMRPAFAHSSARCSLPRPNRWRRWAAR